MQGSKSGIAEDARGSNNAQGVVKETTENSQEQDCDFLVSDFCYLACATTAGVLGASMIITGIIVSTFDFDPLLKDLLIIIGSVSLCISLWPLVKFVGDRMVKVADNRVAGSADVPVSLLDLTDMPDDMKREFNEDTKVRIY